MKTFKLASILLLLAFSLSNCKKSETDKVEITITSNSNLFNYKIIDLNTNQTIISDVFDTKYLPNGIDVKQINKGNYKISAKDLEMNFKADKVTNNIYLDFQ